MNNENENVLRIVPGNTPQPEATLRDWLQKLLDDPEGQALLDMPYQSILCVYWPTEDGVHVGRIHLGLEHFESVSVLQQALFQIQYEIHMDAAMRH